MQVVLAFSLLFTSSAAHANAGAGSALFQLLFKTGAKEGGSLLTALRASLDAFSQAERAGVEAALMDSIEQTRRAFKTMHGADKELTQAEFNAILTKNPALAKIVDGLSGKGQYKSYKEFADVVNLSSARAAEIIGSCAKCPTKYMQLLGIKVFIGPVPTKMEVAGAKVVSRQAVLANLSSYGNAVARPSNVSAEFGSSLRFEGLDRASLEAMLDSPAGTTTMDLTGLDEALNMIRGPKPRNKVAATVRPQSSEAIYHGLRIYGYRSGKVDLQEAMDDDIINGLLKPLALSAEKGNMEDRAALQDVLEALRKSKTPKDFCDNMKAHSATMKTLEQFTSLQKSDCFGKLFKRCG